MERRLGWSEEELPHRRKGDAGKVAVARRLRQETTLSLSWIARRLEMGSWSYVSNLLNGTTQPRPATNALQGALPLFQ